MGVILGTAAYMSPEQACGNVVDKRTDIWAFGCVLFETLTGQRAFRGKTVADALAAVVEREPDWAALPASTPAAIQRLLRRCLDKDPRRRLRHSGEARRELDDALAAAKPVGEGRRQSPKDVRVRGSATTPSGRRGTAARARR
jgi:eukaryotic-like serine/threonine-protein kinase